MQHTTFPGTDLVCSQLALGTGSFGTHIKGDDARRLVSKFVEAGGNMLDTAHCYAFWEPGGLGLPERELGQCLRDLGIRDEIIVATKGGHPPVLPDYPRPDDWMSERTVSRDLDESLERLGMERVDLYYLHRDSPEMPVDEIIGMLNREIEKGRVRHVGASNWTVGRIEEANAYARTAGLQGFCASQILWSLATPKWRMGADPTNRYGTPEDAVWYLDHDVPVVAYSATANGYFAGREVGTFETEDNGARRGRARDLAAELGCTPTQVAVAWLLHQPCTTIPLFATGDDGHMKEALGACEVALTDAQVAWLSGLDG